MKTEAFNIFTPKQRQAIKDCIRYGFWGDTDMEYVTESGFSKPYYSYGAITNYIVKGGHFPNHRSIPGIISGISKKIKKEHIPFLLIYPDWWGDGSGDLMFFNMEYLECKSLDELLEWAKIEEKEFILRKK